MKIFEKVMGFLFGKDPDIFDEQGRVSHKFPKKKWDAWYNRTKANPEYNWRNHTGVSGAPTPSNSSNSKKM
jgi:hypothetical protein